MNREGRQRMPPDDVNRLSCVFDQALLARAAVCEQVRRYGVGEGELLSCASPVARAGCAAFYGLLRAKSMFALRLKEPHQTLPHAAAMKLQCGGLDGLRGILDPEAPAPDVHRLVRAANERAGGLEALPLAAIIQGVAAWRGRTQRR